jgi:hypothetical protein
MWYPSLILPQNVMVQILKKCNIHVKIMKHTHLAKKEKENRLGMKIRTISRNPTAVLAEGTAFL